ncbi:MAG: ral secretion pathway protein, partial [Acetobacteraceae bacterium]|nr:ral secretion pathway protein [Acetobacteraceae bacterium]
MSIRQRGFALLIVLWTVGFLALLGTRIVAAGRTDTQLATNLKQDAVLRAAADGAIANAVFHVLAARDSRLAPDGVTREVRIGQTPVLVRIENESDRINLNTASAVLLRTLILEMGVAPALADRVAGAILDWRTSGENSRPNGAKATEYRAAGLAYGPPGAPFQSVGELADVLGMTPQLFERLAPHLTVMTDGDPDMSTRDPVVARALTDAGGVADDVIGGQQTADEVLRITVIAMGFDAARYAVVAVVSANLQNASPRVNILLREPLDPEKVAAMITHTLR